MKKSILFLLGIFLAVISNVRASTVTITADPGDTVCVGTWIKCTAHANNATISNYIWYKNGSSVLASPTDSIYTSVVAGGDILYCVVAGTYATGGSFSGVYSNMIRIVTPPPVIPTISVKGIASTLPGNTITLNAIVANAGPTYVVKWHNRGVLFATTTVPTVSYVKGPGIDTITATVASRSNGCYDSTSTSAVFYVSDPTGVKALGNEGLGISIYPNPAHSELFINSQNKIDNVAVYNMLGQTMAVANTYTNAAAVKIAIAQLPAGVYLVEVLCGEQLYVHKVLKE